MLAGLVMFLIRLLTLSSLILFQRTSSVGLSKVSWSKALKFAGSSARVVRRRCGDAGRIEVLSGLWGVAVHVLPLSLFSQLLTVGRGERVQVVGSLCEKDHFSM